ncbi:Meprin A [Flagellimonas maritima]|uniref:Meprin A n=1 Tax=Flagellimonas maritima TaxID=1383885 RepID=A0A2Z4LT90_9FLAO|nr:M12 family metallopeptidase [Allomuricauda aurantiaca]AWX44942.1 Meprin A [Allomuricauda aurantiaca]
MEKSTNKKKIIRGIFLMLSIPFLFFCSCRSTNKIPTEEEKELSKVQKKPIQKPILEFKKVEHPNNVVRINNQNRLKIKQFIKENKVEFMELTVFLPFFSNASLEVVEVKNGNGYIDGDIEIGKIEDLIAVDSLIQNGTSFAFGLNQFDDRLWKGGLIPFEIKTSDFRGTRAISEINKAIDSINTRTNLTMIPRTSQDEYIKIETNGLTNNSGSSPVGKCGTCHLLKNSHIVRLSSAISESVIKHEFLHTAGVYHEQSRPDRDDFVTINFDCIQDGRNHNFKKRNGTAFGDYDATSIMHYASTTFSRPSCNSISPNDGVTSLGNNNFTARDINGLEIMYNSKHGKDGTTYMMLMDKERDVRNGYTIVDGNVRIIESPSMPNDDIHGLRVRNFPSGATIKVFDNKSDDNQDDFSEIIFKRDASDIVIYNFEQNSDSNPDFRIVYTTVAGSGNINGKVSRIEVDLSPPIATSANKILHPKIELREGNGGTQGFAGSITNFQNGSTFNFTQIGTIDNDKARSMVLFDIPAGTVIKVFDNSNASRLDDWAEIIVKRDISQKVIDSFERHQEDDDIRVIYFKEGNLDGKISRLEISDIPTGPMLNLYSGGFDSGEIKATITLTENLDIDCKNNNRGISNDDISYMKLYNVESGTRIFVFDHNDDRLSNTTKRDDWTLIRVDRNVKFKNIATFEQTINTDTDGVTRLYNGGGNLDGKISFIQIRK